MTARCAQHPNVEATLTCARCGRFACDSCGHRLHDGPKLLEACDACREAVARTLRPQYAPSALSTIACAIPFACWLPFAGLLAAGLGWFELRRIARGKSPLVSRPWARAAIVLGLINAAINALFVFTWLARR